MRFRFTSHKGRLKALGYSFTSAAICLSFFSIGISPAQATDGILDTSFGSGGKVVANLLGSTGEYSLDIAEFSDGSYITVGFNPYLVAPAGGVIMKYSATGILDTSFGTNGRVSNDAISGFRVVEAIEALSNGSFLVAGRGQVGSQDDFVLAKYTSTGALDTSFGTGGKVTTDVGGNQRSDSGNAINISLTGEIYVSGTSRRTTDDFAIAKYTSTGILDTSYSGDGLAFVDFSGTGDSVNSAQLLSNGSLLVAGYSIINGDSASAIVKLTPSGDADTTFGLGGKITGDYVASDEEVTSLSVSASGEIFAAISAGDFMVAKYSASGVLQTSFGSTGFATIDFSGGTDSSSVVQVLIDGSLLIGGFATVSGSADFAIAKVSSSGVLDTSFGVSGKTAISLSSGDDTAETIAVTPAGKILMAGTADRNNAQSKFGIVRLSGVVPIVTTTTTTTTTTLVTTTTTPVTTTTTASSPSTTVPAPKESVVLDLPAPSKPLLADTALAIGEPVVLEFGGFVPGEFVQLLVASTPRVIASGYANNKGFVKLSGEIPENLLAGKHSLALYAPVSGRGVRQPISVTSTTGPQSLPDTGGSSGFSLSMYLLLLGLTMLIGARLSSRTLRS